MAKTFKIGYKTRLKLQRAIQAEIRSQGLLDTYAMLDSVRISSATGDLNQLYVTVNAVYYYMFLDLGADLWNGGQIRSHKVTQNALNSQQGKEFQKECVDAYVNWMIANYPILDVGKISVNKLKINLTYNLFGDESGSWNGQFQWDGRFKN